MCFRSGRGTPDQLNTLHMVLRGFMGTLHDIIWEVRWGYEVGDPLLRAVWAKQDLETHCW